MRYGASRYWVAYAITFMSDERIVDAHAAEAVRIERDPCPGGEEIMPRVFLCR